MARNDIDADAAFALLKSHSQQTGQKLIEVAEAVTRTHRLLPAAPLGNTVRPIVMNNKGG
jgi:hypothetical protein